MVSLPSSEKSLWRDDYRQDVYGPVIEDIHVDVAIIGAGITGLTSAYLLKKAGKTVAVLDKDTVGGGTTGRTTGKVTSQHGLIYTELSKTLDNKSLQIYADSAEAAVRLIDQIITQENIQCDWERDDNYVFTADHNEVKKFRLEADIAASLNLPASFETDLPLPFGVKAAVKFSNQGKFNAQKYLLGLAASIHGDGSFIFEQSNVTTIKDGGPCIVKANRSKVVAGDIIIATNVPTLPLLARGAYCTLEYPTESYIVDSNFDGSLNGMYISPDKSHYSILPITVNGRRRILVGGGGHLSGLRGSKKYRFNKLANYANQHFGISEFTNKWSDRDYIAYDKVPIIGKVYPWSKRLYVGSAYKKWGLTSGTSAAMILSDTILGNKNDWAPVFRPQRLEPIRKIPKAVVEQIKQITSP